MQITDASSLQGIKNNLGEKYVLAKHITLNSDFQPIGGMVSHSLDATEPAATVFTGIFDGAGCSISDLR